MGKLVTSAFYKHPVKFAAGAIIDLCGLFALVALIVEAF